MCNVPSLYLPFKPLEFLTRRNRRISKPQTASHEILRRLGGAFRVVLVLHRSDSSWMWKNKQLDPPPSMLAALTLSSSWSLPAR